MGTKRIESIPQQKAKGLCRWCEGPIPKGRRRSWCGEKCVHEARMRSDPQYVRAQVQKRDHGLCAICGLSTSRLPGMAQVQIIRAARIEPIDRGFRIFTTEQTGIPSQAMGDAIWRPYDETWDDSGTAIHGQWLYRRKPLRNGFWSVRSTRREYFRTLGYLRLREAIAFAFHPHARWALSDLQQCRCGYCEWARSYDYHPDRHTWEADHIVPVVEGGGGCGLEGYRTLCIKCHKAETAKLAARRAAIQALVTTADGQRRRDRRRHGDDAGQELLF